ncbi:hypothetical protein ACFE04_017742 [Oxalis oulophora]
MLVVIRREERQGIVVRRREEREGVVVRRREKREHIVVRRKEGRGCEVVVVGCSWLWRIEKGTESRKERNQERKGKVVVATGRVVFVGCCRWLFVVVDNRERKGEVVKVLIGGDGGRKKV